MTTHGRRCVPALFCNASTGLEPLKQFETILKQFETILKQFETILKQFETILFSQDMIQDINLTAKYSKLKTVTIEKPQLQACQKKMQS